jgi:DMSO/TMAO reductase YedYZ molybdopterin-dependent catalytic subunit
MRGAWSLEVGGMVDRPLRLSLQQLMDMPRMSQRVNHYCVEGWTAVEQWTGVRLSDLAKLAGVHKGAEYVDFESFDDGYHESWDIESAMHHQTVVAYGLDGHMLGPAHGAPARVYSPVKLGYKNTKYLTKIMFLPKRNGGYWSDQAPRTESSHTGTVFEMKYAGNAMPAARAPTSVASIDVWRNSARSTISFFLSA